MRVVDKKQAYFIESFFDSGVIAGFTKDSAKRDLPLNIKEALSFLSKDLKIGYLRQVHSSTVNFIDSRGLYEGDGLFTKQNNLVCVVKTADCLPIFFHSKDLDTIGIIHMGWRSAKEAILDKIGKKQSLSSYKVSVGVGLRKCCYRVGKEFLDYPNLSSYLEARDGALYFDPINFTKDCLMSKGFNEKNFFDVNICSLCSQGNFFSYRRDHTLKRNLSFIVKQ